MSSVTTYIMGDVRRRALRGRINAYIEGNLDDPDLDPRAVAAANNVSVRELHRLFEGGRTVSEMIKMLRLERCRRDLLDPALTGVPIYHIARRHGILHNSYFSRVFKAAYGLTPRQLRRGGVAGFPSTTALC
ncbi:helix-turn-helix transcriptional regulator [Dactylosporangium sp. CA-139066]|uniref:helix-turn-helix transcriptional regulator n=1 Tax=Dactylosporangium sp. CA-139066 TaxID=3239930 RepID=UPI003D90AEC0